ncbi:hypothetical protein D9M70_521430 [compost metagenome]
MVPRANVNPRRLEHVGHYICFDLGCGAGNVVSGYSLVGHLQYSSVELPVSLAGSPSAVRRGMGVLLFPHTLRKAILFEPPEPALNLAGIN